MFYKIALIALLALFPFQAKAVSNCDITSLNNMNFGSYDPLGQNASSPLDTTGYLRIYCFGLPYTLVVNINQGQNPAAGSSCTSPRRQMSSASGAKLAYGLYRDAGYSSPWGCNSSVTANIPIFLDRTFNIYGRIPAGQMIPPGAYTDTLSVTITF